MTMNNFQEYSSSKWNKTWENFLLNKALEKKLSKTEKRVFITRFKQENWDKKIEDFCEQSEVAPETFLKHQTQIFHTFEDEYPELIKHQHKFPILHEHLLNLFKHSNSYIPKDDYQDERCQYVLQPGALIRIKAPSKMGKTRLLNNMLNFANEQEYKTVHIKFLQIESNSFQSLELFLRWFCISISYALNLKIDLEQYWDENIDSIVNCKIFLEDVLHSSQQPLVIGLDDVDRLLKYPNISQDFFYLLRSLHEDTNNEEFWGKLRFIVVYSTEDFSNLDINKSPFNVGIPIELKSLNRQQIEKLAQLYKLNLSNLEIDQLIDLLGGHPYLVDLMLSNLSSNSQTNLTILLEQAPTEIGIYSSFLRELLINLRENDRLAKVFLEIINSQIPIQIDILLAYQLYWMGLIQWSNSGNTVFPYCELYQLYFQDRLSLEASQK